MSIDVTGCGARGGGASRALLSVARADKLAKNSLPAVPEPMAVILAGESGKNCTIAEI